MIKQTVINYDFLKEPIVEKFLENPSNKKTFNMYIEKPTLENEELLDNEFKEFYQRARVRRYLSTMIKVSSVDFDKRNRKINKRFLLTLDAPIKQDGEIDGTRIEMIPAETEQDEITLRCTSLDQCITDSEIYRTYIEFTDKQKKILNLVCVHKLNLQEIASLFGDTRQNIFNIYKRSLKKMQHNYKRKE